MVTEGIWKRKHPKIKFLLGNIDIVKVLLASITKISIFKLIIIKKIENTPLIFLVKKNSNKINNFVHFKGVAPKNLKLKNMFLRISLIKL